MRKGAERSGAPTDFAAPRDAAASISCDPTITGTNDKTQKLFIVASTELHFAASPPVAENEFSNGPTYEGAFSIKRLRERDFLNVRLRLCDTRRRRPCRHRRN